MKQAQAGIAVDNLGVMTVQAYVRRLRSVDIDAQWFLSTIKAFRQTLM
jgi:hypothetical protein